MAEQGNRTFLQNLVDPEVLADMIGAKLDKKIRVAPIAKIDNTLEGRPGSTITVPRYNYVASASVVPEGEEIGIHKLTTSTANYQVKKVADGFRVSDEAVLSGYGDPMGEGTNQIVMGIADYIDSDAMGELGKGNFVFQATNKISYENIVDTIDKFEEEINTPKVMFVHPNQVATLRKDANFISADKYGLGTNVVMYGEIGMICNTRIVPSKRVINNPACYIASASTASGALKVVASGATTGEVNWATIEGKAYPVSTTVGDYVVSTSQSVYFINPIVKLNGDAETEEDTSALTIFLKRDTNVEVERKHSTRETEVTADKFYVAALTNASKVALLFAKKA